MGEINVIITSKDNCTGCAACVNVCPAKCISMTQDTDGFLYPAINEEKCILCGLCKKICNVEEKSSGKIEAYACYNQQKEERLKSSSGGIFAVLAKEILKKNGVVFGVKMNGIEAEHTYIECVEDLDKLLGSKYIQSNVGLTYNKVKTFLEQGREVLFCGTPCQVAALNKVLQKKYDNLLLVDFICHGISSPEIFRQYIKEIHLEDKKIKNISFRDKTEGWNNFSLRMDVEGQDCYRKNMQEDIFLQSFLKNMNLRTSCFSCKHRTVNRISDLTLGDFWGSKEVFDDWKEEKGYSVVLIQSKKGERIFQDIKKSITYKNVEIEKIVEYNQSLLVSPWDEFSKDLFFKYVKKNTIKNSIKKVEQDGVRKKIGRKWWKIWKKLRKR